MNLIKDKLTSDNLKSKYLFTTKLFSPKSYVLYFSSSASYNSLVVSICWCTLYRFSAIAFRWWPLQK